MPSRPSAMSARYVSKTGPWWSRPRALAYERLREARPPPDATPAGRIGHATPRGSMRAPRERPRAFAASAAASTVVGDDSQPHARWKVPVAPVHASATTDLAT